MIPGKYDITIHRGGTWNISLESEDENGVDTDFSDYDEARMQIRPPWIKGVPVKAPLLELTTGSGHIVISGTTVTLTISAQETASLDFDEGQYELEFVKHVDLGAVPPIPKEIVDKLILGSVAVTGEITV